MRRALKLVVVVTAGIGLLASVASASSSRDHRLVKYVRVAAKSAFYVDNDPSGNSGGDSFGSTGDLRHAGQKVGTYSSACTASSAERAQCQVTFRWHGGDRLQLAGDYKLQAPRNEIAIVGGTGRFRRARGEATLKPGSQDGSIQRARLVIVR